MTGVKIIGLVLIIGALIGLTVIGAAIIPDYLRDRDFVAQAQSEATKAQAELETIATNPAARERSRGIALRDADQATLVLQSAQGSIARRRDEALTYGGGAAGVLAVGVVLFLLGRRKATTPQLAAL